MIEKPSDLWYFSSPQSSYFLENRDVANSSLRKKNQQERNKSLDIWL